MACCKDAKFWRRKVMELLAEKKILAQQVEDFEELANSLLETMEILDDENRRLRSELERLRWRVSKH